jgi:hypothetical protein
MLDPQLLGLADRMERVAQANQSRDAGSSATWLAIRRPLLLPPITSRLAPKPLDELLPGFLRTSVASTDSLVLLGDVGEAMIRQD